MHFFACCHIINGYKTECERGGKMTEDSLVKVDLERLGQNARVITERYSDYDYYIGVLKSDGYGHGMGIVNRLYENGINYFAVASLAEAAELRRYNKSVPVLLLEPIALDRIELAEQLDCTLPVHCLDYAKSLLSLKRTKPLKIHFQVDSGFNRLGFKSKTELKSAFELLQPSVYTVEGIYQHFATAGIFDPLWDRQVKSFLEITSLIDLKKIPIVHMGSGVSLLAHPKIPFANGIRMGLVMYGYNIAPSALSGGLKDRLRAMRNSYFKRKYNISETYSGVKIDLLPAMTFETRILQIKDVKKGETVGYNALYKAEEDIKIAVLAMGYNNGIGHKNLGRNVLINQKKYPIIGEIGMNMTAIRVDGSVKPDDRAVVLGEGITLGAFSRSADMGLGESLMSIGKNNRRIYVDSEKAV